MYEVSVCGHELMKSLKDAIYSHIPDELWDRQLWLYRYMLDYLDQAYKLINTEPTNTKFYIKSGSCETKGILCVVTKGYYVHLLVGANDNEYIKDVVYHLKNTMNLPIRITSIKKCVAMELGRHYKCRVNYDYVVYYKHYLDTRAAHESSPKSYKKIGLKELSDHMIEYKANEYGKADIYGYYLFDNLISICGFIPVTKYKAEILFIKTIDKVHLRKGYGKKLCRYVMEIILKDYKLVTMRVDVENKAMNRLATSLDFKQAYIEYYLDID